MNQAEEYVIRSLVVEPQEYVKEKLRSHTHTHDTNNTTNDHDAPPPPPPPLTTSHTREYIFNTCFHHELLHILQINPRETGHPHKHTTSTPPQTNDHTKDHPPHLTTIEGGAATVRTTSHTREYIFNTYSPPTLVRVALLK